MGPIIKKTKLKIIACEGGDIMHALKNNESSYKKFGEVYFSKVDQYCIKGWKKHLEMTCNLVVPIGNVKFVFFDSNLQFISEESIGQNNYLRITTPPGIWFAFQGLSKECNLILNIADITHSENEIERLPLEEINYNWG